MAVDFGAEVKHIQLRDFSLPIFDQDVEAEGFPESATQLQELFEQSDSLLIAAPEYNSSITPLLKNTIDWVTRPNGDRKPLQSYQGKIACLIAASPGALGGLRGLRHVREILSNINVLVVPDQFALSSAFDAFSEDGQLKDEKNTNRLKNCIQRFVETAKRQVQ